jgi:uncharacterized protein with LGFP repeats
MSEVGNQAAWSSVVDGLVFNTDTAIAQKWLELKSYGTFIGVPVSDEISDPDTGGVQMAFSSGAVIRWDAATGASVG